LLTARTAPVESLYSQSGRIPHEEILRRAKAVLSIGRPSAGHLANKYRGKLIIAGGGPSLAETLPDIRRQTRVSKTTKIAAVNRTHDWLLKKGCKPDFGILIDPKPWVANYMTPTAGVKYCIGAKVDVATWQRFAGHPEVYHWHPLELAGEKDVVQGNDWMMVPGQSTVGLRSVPFGYALGFRKFELHGLDCNKRGDAGHAYEKFTPAEKLRFNPESDLGNQLFYIKSQEFGTRFYEGTTHMTRQCGEFRNMVNEFRELDRRGQEPCDIRVAGVSAMGYLAALMGMHVNEAYNENPASMPTDWTIDPNDIDVMPEPMSVTGDLLDFLLSGATAAMFGMVA
jgi:hypothetical protein